MNANQQTVIEKKNLKITDLAICLIIVILLFLPTINRTWLYYDEGIIYQGTYFPNISSIGEAFEIVKEFGLRDTLISSNTIYSSNYVTRSCPLDQVFGMLGNLLLKKDPLGFHIFNLTLHLINTCLVFFILRNYLNNRFLNITFTLIWAIHPVMVEAILLSTNWGATFVYLFFFGLILDFLKNKQKNGTLLRRILLPILILIPLLKNEQIITLPFVLFIISFSKAYKEHSFKESLKVTLTETGPYFVGLIFYLIFYLFFYNHGHTSQPASNWLVIFTERIFWLSPQIFFHFLKLIFYPAVLSIDQSLFVKLGKTLLDSYSIFCTLFFTAWLFIPLFLFLTKKKYPNIFFLCWGFFFALLPFLHILTPSYTLVQERYLYMPLAIFIFGIANIRRGNPVSTATTTTATIVLLSILLSICFIRSYIRTLDWKDNYLFINASYKTSAKPLFKAIRLGMLGKVITIFEPLAKEKAKQYFLKTLDLLNEARLETIKNKNKYQKTLPLVIKSYGLDYDSLLSKIAYLEASSRCLELNQDYKIGLKVLEPYIKKAEKLDPFTLDLYIHLLLLDKRFKDAKDILLEVNSIHPHMYPILTALFDIATKYENDLSSAEKYLNELLKYYPYNINVLTKAFGFYQGYKDPLLTARFAYLYGLRTQSDIAYEQAFSIYLDLNRLNEAKKIIPKLLRISSNNPEILFLISKYYYKIKDYKNALSYLDHSYLISKKENIDSMLAFDIAYTLAKFYTFLGVKTKAIPLKEEILKLAGNNVQYLIKVAKLYKTLELTEDFNNCVKKIKSLSKENEIIN